MIATAFLLMAQASVPAGDIAVPAFAPATAEQVWSQFAKLCLNGPADKIAFVRAVETSEWGFTRRELSGQRPDRVAADGRWQSPRGLVTAYHGEPNLKVSMPYQCALHASPEAGGNVELLEQTGAQVLGVRPTSRYVTSDRTNLQWYDAAYSDRFSRQISLAHVLKNTPQQTLTVFVAYEPRKSE